MGHEHGINVYLPEQRCGEGNRQWDTDLGGLAKLALVAGVDEPLDILLERGPPEAVCKRMAGQIEPLVTEVVVCVANKGHALGVRGVKLVVALDLVLPEPS